MNKRHNLILSNETWAILTELKKLQSKSISSIIEDTVQTYLEVNKYNKLYFKLLNISPFCDKSENEEISKSLDSLTEDDLKVSRTFEL
jgi:hypothetical protein